ncbi:MAG: methyltransferase, partial [Nanoarchaeota archaeon]|nr:methyltransferase [Nanoarchaeota archaeon]
KAKNKKIKSVMEVGCGSGLLSIIAAKSGCDVLAADINPAAVACAKRNAGLNNADIKAVQSDLFRQVRGKFDLIVFNPPYLPEEQTESSRAWAGGKNLEIISRFIMQAKRFLSRSGEMLIVVSSLSKPEKILRKFSDNGFSAKIIAERKIPWEKLFAICAKTAKNA